VSEVREQVREHYREVAIDVRNGGEGCCESGCCGTKDQVWGAELYEAAERAELPDAAVLASLGCGNPTAVAELREGETVLDLGSGGGIDVLLSARRVGPTGRAFGLDMTDEMLDLARCNSADAGAENVEFVKGYIEDVPLPDASVDVIISNCVINLSADKTRVFQEMRRVLRPGGRIGISDVVAADDLSPTERAERGTLVGCIAGALSFREYRSGLEHAGIDAIEIEPTHEVAGGIISAIVRARRPD
jgi:SAM-dependent methyltransferase